MEGQVTSAEWFRAGEGRNHSEAGWEVKALFSDPATFITKGFVLLSGKSLSTRMETGSAHSRL